MENVLFLIEVLSAIFQVIKAMCAPDEWTILNIATHVHCSQTTSMCFRADQRTVDSNNTDPEAKNLYWEMIYADTTCSVNNIRYYKYVRQTRTVGGLNGLCGPFRG